MGKTNLDKVKQTAEDIEKTKNPYGGSGGKMPVLNWEEKLYRLRILPPPDGMEEPWRRLTICFGVGPNKKVVIPRRQYGLEPCPMTDKLDKLASKTDKASAAELKKIKPSTRFKLFCIDRENEDAGPICVDLNVIAHKDLLGFFMDPEFGDLADPDEGRDIKIKYTPAEKTKGKTFAEFTIVASPKVTPLRPAKMSDEDYAEMLSTNYYDKYKVGFPHSAEYAAAVLAGTDADFKGNWVTNIDGSPLPKTGRDDSVDTDEDDDSDEPTNVNADDDGSDPPENDTEDDGTTDNTAAVDAAVAHASVAKPAVSAGSIRDQIAAKLKGAQKK